MKLAAKTFKSKWKRKETIADLLALEQAEKIDVDTRFLLANERTLLSWVRTALALVAGGLAFSHFGSNSTVNILFGTFVMVTGAGMAVLGYSRYKAADKAIRTGSLPPATNWAIIQVAAVVIFTLMLACLQLSMLHS